MGAATIRIVIIHYLCLRCVQNRNGSRFSKFKMAANAFLNFYKYAFPTSSMFQLEVPIFPLINFGDDRSNSKQIAAVFRNPL